MQVLMLPRLKQEALFVIMTTSLILIASILTNVYPLVMGQPTYSVVATMPNRTINPLFEGPMNMTFSISGVGSFVEGSVKVESDFMNLVKWSLRVHGYYVATYGELVQFYDSSQINYDYSTTIGPTFSKGFVGKYGFPGPVPNATNGYVDSSKILLFGSVILDSSDMSSGSYTIKVTFAVHNQRGNHEFDDSIDYVVLDLWEANPWAAPLVAGLIVAVIVGFGRWLWQRNRKSSEISVRREYRGGSLKSEEIRFVGSAATQYADSFSMSITTQTSPVNMKIAEARDLVEHGKYDDADRMAQIILTMNLSAKEPLLLLKSQANLIRGDAAFGKGLYEEAERFYASCKELATVVKDDLLLTTAIHGLGAARGAQGRNEEALAAFEEVLRLNPNDTKAWSNKVNALGRLGRNEEALTACEEALKLNANDSAAWDNKGAALSHLGRHEEALTACEEALKLNPNYAKAWYGKGTALGNLGKHREALAAFEEALKLNPNYAEALDSRGAALSHLGHRDEALVSFEKAVKLNPKYANAWYNKGAALSHLLQYEQAIAACEEAIKLKPSDVEAWNNKTFALFCLGRNTEALASANQALRIAPDNIKARSLRDRLEEIRRRSLPV